MVKSSAVLSHVAFVLPSVEKAAKVFAQNGLMVSSPEVFEGEGTKEIYVGDVDHQAALPLLMEPTRAGSYSRSLEKRGPGLHHIAVDVDSVEDYLAGLSGSGWFLHLNSLRSAREFKTVYLARPGVPALIEVQEKAASQDPHLVTEIHLKLNEEQLKMIRSLGLSQVFSSSEEHLVLDNKRIYFKELY